MSFASSRTAKICIDRLNARLIAAVSAVVLSVAPAFAWEIDLSRRQVDFNRVTEQSRLPASETTSEPAGLLDRALAAAEPSQDVVIMNTEKGFVPSTVYFRKGGSYRVHVVNVNAKEKNVSFVFDAFSEHHNTLFGQVKTFTVTPKADGVFSFQCPETAMQGRAVVAVPGERKPASN